MSREALVQRILKAERPSSSSATRSSDALNEAAEFAGAAVPAWQRTALWRALPVEAHACGLAAAECNRRSRNPRRMI